MPRRVGAGGAEGEGAAAGSRDLGEGVGRAAPRCAASEDDSDRRCFFMGRCIFPLWAGPRYGERHTSPHWALRHCICSFSCIKQNISTAVTNYRWFDFFNLKFDHLTYLKNLSDNLCRFFNKMSS